MFEFVPIGTGAAIAQSWGGLQAIVRLMESSGEFSSFAKNAAEVYLDMAQTPSLANLLERGNLESTKAVPSIWRFALDYSTLYRSIGEINSVLGGESTGAISQTLTAGNFNSGEYSATATQISAFKEAVSEQYDFVDIIIAQDENAILIDGV